MRGFNRKQAARLEITNANAAWVTAELQKLYAEWIEWNKFAERIEDHPYDKSSQADCFADGRDNLQKHEILRTKTLTFLDNNLRGHNFMLSNEYDRPFENNLLRLRDRVPHRVHELNILIASLQYAIVPDGFWKEQGKKMVEQLAMTGPEKAIDVAASWLRNPLSSK